MVPQRQDATRAHARPQSPTLAERVAGRFPCVCGGRDSPLHWDHCPTHLHDRILALLREVLEPLKGRLSDYMIGRVTELDGTEHDWVCMCGTDEGAPTESAIQHDIGCPIALLTSLSDE